MLSKAARSHALRAKARPPRLLSQALEKERRADALRQKAVRRIKNQGISRGWVAWHEHWTVHVCRKRMLQHAAAKLKNPELAEAFHIWQDMRAEMIAAKEKRAWEQKYAAVRDFAAANPWLRVVLVRRRGRRRRISRVRACRSVRNSATLSCRPAAISSNDAHVFGRGPCGSCFPGGGSLPVW